MVEWRKDGAPLWGSEVRANKIMQTAWWWSALNNLREEVSFLLPSTTKRKSGRSLQFGKEGSQRPKEEKDKSESLIYLIVKFVVFFFCDFSCGIQCMKRCLLT